MADFIYHDKEIPSTVKLMSRPATASHNRIVGKTFLTANVSANQPRRKVLADVNRRAKATQQFSKKFQDVKPKRPEITLKKDQKNKVESITVKKQSPARHQEKENMHLVPPEKDTYEDIWALNYPILPENEPDSFDDIFDLRDSDSDTSLVLRDAEDRKDSFPWDMSADFIPTAADFSLPPLDF